MLHENSHQPFNFQAVDQSSLYSIKLQAALKRISADLIRPERLNSSQQINQDDKKKVKFCSFTIKVFCINFYF